MRNFVFLLILITLSSCSGYYYTASPHHVPLNTGKGELKTNIGINSLQAGYTISNHLSLFTTGYYRYKATNISFETMLGKENSGDDIHADKSYEINLGGSYFYNYNKLVFEVLFGAGIGNLEFEHVIDLYEADYEFNLNSQKYNIFIQPNIGIKFNEHISLNLSTKFSQQHLYNIKTDLVWGDYTNEAISDDYFFNKSNANLYFIEPGLTFQFGGERVKMQTQIIPVFNLSETYIRYRELSLNLSLFVNLNLNGQ